LGWILPEVLDPDGHALRFYTMEHHTDLHPGQTTTIHDPRETAERREAAEQASDTEHVGPGAGRLRALGASFALGFKTSPGAPVRGCAGH